METKERNVEDYARPEGMEVKVSTGRITVLGLSWGILIVIVGVLLFNFIWGGASSYNAGYELGGGVK